ncbi:hypothetical protein QYE76_022559 [Lolium multiflorum]|uniref:Uncharacterized protein n=1 Tax=Lolium multiflorum TaxID=4521 RepID=A0AAD8VRC6_LOLMU|nr:hypothetical protein QYE76_022559 [Lolium multiflorum]
MPMDWEWGFLPLSSTNPPTDDAKERFPRITAEKRGPCRKRDLDEVDPDPYVPWTQLKMGGTNALHPEASSASANPQVLDHATPLQAEVGQEFLDKLASQGKKNKAPATEAGSSHAPPAKRARQEVVGGKTVSRKEYRRREMPVASGAALKISKSATGMPPESSEETARTSSRPQPSPVPSEHRAEEDNASPPETQDTGASNTSADTEAAGREEPLVPSVPKKKKKTSASSPSKTVPDSSAPASSTPVQDAPDAPAPPKTAPKPPPAASTGEPAAANPTPPPSQDPAAAKPTAPEGVKLSKPKAAAVTSAATSGPQSLVLHAGRAAIVAGETAPAPLGRITELTRGGADLGHLLDYAEKWNQADESPTTRGMVKDKMPVIDPAGPRSTGQHFSRLRRAVKEFDNSTADARKRLFEELLWEHRDLAEAHSHCQSVPEASIEALKTQLATLQAEKEQLIQSHRKALGAQEVISAQLKEKLVQTELWHDQERKNAKAAAESKLDETLKEFTDSTAVLRAELEEHSGARKAAEDRIALLNVEQKEYDQLVVQTDALAFRLFPDSQLHANKKVMERRAAQQMTNPNAPWDPYDHLVALSARVQHMRAVDRHLVDLPDVAI